MPKYKRLPRVLEKICRLYVAYFRGTPLVVQLLVGYFVLRPLLGRHHEHAGVVDADIVPIDCGPGGIGLQDHPGELLDIHAVTFHGMVGRVAFGMEIGQERNELGVRIPDGRFVVFSF